MTEDDSAICLIVAIILHRMGHIVQVVHNGKDAIKECNLKPGHFDILITDHNMPRGTGLELIHHLRKNGFNGKVIVMSGSLTDDLMYAYKDRRVDKILQKPFTVTNLSSVLVDLFRQWSQSASGEMEAV